MDRDDIPEAAPKRPGREPKKPLPRRFYQTVGTGAVEAPADGFAILLDGKGVRTPAKRVLVLPVADLAEAIAAEWRAQAKVIDPATMPLTTLAMTAIDAVAGQEGVVAAEIVRYAGSDMLCYRATGPDTLQRRQRETWDPILDWAKAELGAEFQVTSGVMPVVQPAAGPAAIAQAITGLDPLRLAATHVLTTMLGSAVLAVAVLRGHLAIAAAWAAAHVDEDWQIEQWGGDHEAEVRREKRRREAEAAATTLAFLSGREQYPTMV